MWRKKRVYICDMCRREAPVRVSSYDTGNVMYPPQGWTHSGGRNGITLCDTCTQVYVAMLKTEMEESDGSKDVAHIT